MKTAEQKLKDRERRAKWRLANPELERENKRKWREANLDKHRAASRAYYHQHKERCSAKSRAYYEANKSKRLANARENALITNFGITGAQYEALLQAQSGCCGLCGKEAAKLHCRLAVDHCHKGGHVRGLLCAGCNRLLGAIEARMELIPDFLKWAARGDVLQDFIRSERQ